MSTEYLYPLDLTGTQPSNLIKNEKHTVSPPSQITQGSFIVMRACPFFGDNIVVKDGTGLTARTLVFGEDYILTHKSIALSLLTNQPVYASVMFKDRNYTGSVYVTYYTVGGEYNLDDYTIVEKLTRQKYILTHTSFDQIVGLPASFPNPPHQHNPIDMVGLGDLVDKMAEVAAAIRSTQGSYGTLNTIVMNHINSQAAHTSAQVGLSNVKNFDIAVIGDYAVRSADKYTTAVTVADHVASEIAKTTTTNGATYLSKTEAGLLYVKAAAVYSKAESDNLYYSKAYLNTNFLKKSEAVTVAQVGGIVNDIVDMSQYHTRTEAHGTFYSRAEADTRYYTRSQMDSNFVTQGAADTRYIQTASASAILSPKVDNMLSIEDGKFYVGLLAPTDVIDLYIDCINGSDNSPGTRAGPLRSLKRAHEITPPNRSSTWHLRHYTIAQMEIANAWYNWNFNHTLIGGVKRTVTIYGNTWIDGAKNSQARQIADGVIRWSSVNQVTRLPLFIQPYKNENSKTQGVSGCNLVDNSQIEFIGMSLTKPKPIDAQLYPVVETEQLCFFRGAGSVYLLGCYLFQQGLYQSVDSTRFKWSIQTANQKIDMVLDGCSYGYVTQAIVNGTTVSVENRIGPFTYPQATERPFQYEFATGTLTVKPTEPVGAGGTGAGASLMSHNMSVVLQRTGMFRGLNIVNGVCTNIVTNLTLVD